MRHLSSMTLLAAVAALAGCGDRRPPAAAPEATPPATSPAVETSPGAPAGELASSAARGGSLRVDAPAPGSISFRGFGPATFGATAEAVRMAWGGDLGDAKPDQPGGCHYLIPQPVGTDGYRTAFMIEGDKFVRIDVRRADATAPGGARMGMTRAQLDALYPSIEEQPHAYTDGRYLRVRDPAGGDGVLVLEVDGVGAQAVVTEWRVGVPPQVDYVEGCS